jgi:hypothetical protein
MTWQYVLKSGPLDVDEWREHFKEQESESTPPFSDSMIGRGLAFAASNIYEARNELLENTKNRITDEDKKQVAKIMREFMELAIKLNKRADSITNQGQQWEADQQCIDMEDELDILIHGLAKIELKY